MSSRLRLAAVVGIAATSLLIGAAPAQAANTYCYPGSSRTVSKSYQDPQDRSKTKYTASITFEPLYNCNGTQIGVHVTKTAASYSGGFNGTGKDGSSHGLQEYGLDMWSTTYQVGEPVGGTVYSGGFKRSASHTFNRYVYNGTYGPDRLKLAWSDASSYAYFQGPNSQYGQNPGMNIFVTVTGKLVHKTGGAESYPG